ncbi:MAG TPA: type VI secretion system protein IglI family protein [Myxococcaceae bacterium]|jgi:hypothetical protein
MADAAPVLGPLDISLLEAPLTGAPPDSTEEEGPDPRLEAVSEHVAKGTYREGAHAAAVLLREGQRDMRLVGAYLFGAFHEQDLKAMPVIFRSIINVLTASWGTFGPPEKRTVFAENGLRWLFKTMSKHMAYHEKAKDDRWSRWCEPDNRAPLEEAVALSNPILAAIATTLPKGSSAESFRGLVAWLQAHLKALPAQLASVPSEPTSEEAPPGDEAGEEEAQPEESRPEPKALRASASGKSAEPGLPISPAMAVLLQKLAAFDTLIARQDFLKAGVVAADVLATVERFDPRVYLPVIFSRFFAGLSMHAQVIEPMLHNTDSLTFRSLDQLFRVDLGAFLDQPSRPDGEVD